MAHRRSLSILSSSSTFHAAAHRLSPFLLPDHRRTDPNPQTLHRRRFSSTPLEAIAQVAATLPSLSPLAAVQGAITAVHSATGLNWWSSIALSTLLAKTATVPFLLRETHSGHRFQAHKMLKDPEAQDSASMSPKSRELERDFAKRFILNRLPTFLLFYYGIQGMVATVPTFTTGGALWFADLTATDDFVLSVVVSVLIWGNLNSDITRTASGEQRFFEKLCRDATTGLAFVWFNSMPTAMFCYFIPSGVFGLWYKSSVKGFMDIVRFQTSSLSTIKKEEEEAALKEQRS